MHNLLNCKVKPFRYAQGDAKNTASDGSDREELPDGSETEHSSSGQETGDKEAVADTRVLKMLYKGFFFEDIRTVLHRFRRAPPTLSVTSKMKVCRSPN